MVDIYDPQTLGIVVFGGFMVISAIGIALVSTFSMKETSYEEALAKQRQELAQAQPPQRTEKKKKDKTAEKKNKEKKKKDEKPSLKPQESEMAVDGALEHQASSTTLQTQELDADAQPASALATKAAPAPATKAVSAKPAPANSAKPAPANAAKAAPAPATKAVFAKPAPTNAAKPAPANSPKAVQVSATKAAPAPSTKSAPVFADPAPTLAQVSTVTRTSPAEASAAPSPKDKKKKEKKVAKVEPAPPTALQESVVREVPVMAVPPVESQKSAPVVEAATKAEKPKLPAPSKKKAGSKKSTESAGTVDTVDAPLYLPYSTVLSTLKNMVFSESEAQQLMEILSERAGVQDSWHTATQKGDPVAVMKKQLEEKERQMVTAQEEATSAKNRLRELSKELFAEKSKVALVETRLSSQLSKREQEMIALQARMQASYQDHLAETQQLNAKIGSLQDQLEKGPNAQLARLQQENSILRDALNKATSQADSKQNAELAKLRQDCARLNKDLGERIEALHSEEQLRKSLESKASVAEKQLCQLQACRVSSEQALQRRLEEVSEELRKAQSSSSSLQTQLVQAQRDSAALSETCEHLATMEVELGEWTGQVEGLKAQLSQVELENKQLQEQLGSVRVLLEASQGKVQEHNTEALMSELQEVKNSLKEKECRVTLLEEELTQLRDEVSRLESSVTQTEAPSNKDDQSQITSLQEELKSVTGELEELRSTANNKAAEQEHLQYSLKLKDDQISSLQADLVQFKQHLDQSKLESTTKIEHLQSSLKEQESRVHSLEEELKQCKECDTNDSSTDDLRVFQTDTINMLQSLFPQISLNTTEDKWLHKFSEKAQDSLSAKEECLESQRNKVTELLARLSEIQENQSTLQTDCDQYRTVLAETEGMLKTLQRSVEEEEIGWRAKVAELEEQLRKSMLNVLVLEETAQNLRAENQNTQQLKQLLSESESQLQSALKEAHAHREELAQVQAELEQTVQTLQAEQALKLQLSEEVEQAHRTVVELQVQIEQLKTVGESPSETEDIAELKERLEKERKLTKDLGQAATKLQQLLRTSQDQLANEKELVRILQDKLQERDEGTEPKEGTSV